jgi:hypothetical protein
METNLRIVGWLQIALHAMTVLVGVFVFFVMGAVGSFVGAQGGHDNLAVMGILGSVGLLVLLICTLISLPAMIIGWGILNVKPWARPLGIILAILEILHLPPLGLALGIYTLVVLFDSRAVAMFEGSRMRLT